ncbi:MAG: COG1361 S-layer family protein [Candidatus Methanoperedens sp.]|nr:COG1361 S-layer family protein [Candidatus Methanoperedens sp.]
MNISNINQVGKSILFATAAILFLIVPVNAEFAIVLEKLSPQPVEPGQDLMLSVMLINENVDANGVRLFILPDSPIILKNENDRIINEGNIIKYGAVVETYLLHIDPRAVSGIYEVKFEAHWISNDQQRETDRTFNVLVRGVPQLAISNITINPELISPQDTFNITFSISNEGTGIAREVQVSAATSGLPFVPIGADTKIIKNLDPGESIPLNYRLLVKDKTLISSYSIPIKMEYKDENGKNTSSASFVGVKVLGDAELSIGNIKNEPQNPVKGDLVTITMRLENSGNGDAKSVKVNLDIPFEGTKTAFLGKIKPDDDAPGVFTFYATQSGDIPYNASIEFEDDLGRHTVKEELALNVRDTNKNGIIIPVIVVVLVTGAFVFYRYRKKK